MENNIVSRSTDIRAFEHLHCPKCNEVYLHFITADINGSKNESSEHLESILYFHCEYCNDNENDYSNGIDSNTKRGLVKMMLTTHEGCSSLRWLP